MLCRGNVVVAVSSPPNLAGTLAEIDLLSRSYRGLSSRTRILVGVGVMAYATFGLFATDKAEEIFNFTPTQVDKDRLNGAIPKLRVVDRKD